MNCIWSRYFLFSEFPSRRPTIAIISSFIIYDNNLAHVKLALIPKSNVDSGCLNAKCQNVLIVPLFECAFTVTCVTSEDVSLSIYLYSHNAAKNLCIHLQFMFYAI